MIKDIVPQKESLELKFLGFNEDCIAKYQKLSEGANYQLQWLKTPQNSNVLDNAISAPTFSAAFRFFREKYNLLLDVVMLYDENQLPLTYNNLQKPNSYFIWDYYDENFSVEKATIFNTYEEAEIECLIKLIELC